MSDKPSIADLEAANPYNKAADFEEPVVEEPVVEPVEEVTEPEEPEVEGEGEPTEKELHAEKTKRGRERAELLRKSEAEKNRLASELAESNLRLAKLEGQMEERLRQGPDMAPPDDNRDPDETLTRGQMEEELRRMRAQDDLAKEEIYQKELVYSAKYREVTFDSLDGHDKEDEILALFRSNDQEDIEKYNAKYSDNPERDFQINLANAERDIYRRENKELAEKLQGKNPKVREEDVDGSGVGGDSATPDATPEKEKVDMSDPRVREFMKFSKDRGGKYHEKLKEKYQTD